MTKGKAGPQGLATPQDAAATSGDVARPSLLSRGAPPPGAPPLEPWFKNDAKLLAAVVARAAQDQAFAGRVAAAVGKLAQQQPGLRKNLHMSAAGGKPGATPVPTWFLMMLLDSYEHLLTSGLAASSAEAHERLTDICFASGRPMSASRVRDLLTRARKMRGAAPSS